MSLNYIGSKLSLLPFLTDHIILEEGDIFGDLFAGTGSVGQHFNRNDNKIISNDICFYSYILNASKLIPFDQSEFDHHHKVMSPLTTRGFITQNYTERTYFTLSNAQRIDGALKYIHEQSLSDEVSHALIASVLYGADKVSNVASVYGAYLKNFKTSALKEISYPRLVSSPIKKNPNEVWNCDILNLPETASFDVVYLDPPYNHRGYGSNYHLLETIALYDDPVIRGKTGLRFDTKEKDSVFTKKSQVKKSFEHILSSIKASRIYLSYNSEGLLSKDELMSIGQERGEVKIYEKEYKRFKSHRNKENSSITEYLFEITSQ